MGKLTFSGALDEGLDNCLKVYETLSTIFIATPIKKHKSISLILTGYVLNYYENNSSIFKTYKLMFRHYLNGITVTIRNQDYSVNGSRCL